MAEKNVPNQSRLESGQALVEYALIVVLCILAFGFALAATGPAIGNVFSNTIYNLVGQNNQQVLDLPDRDQFWATVTWVAVQTQQEVLLASPTGGISTPTSTQLPSPVPPTAGPSPTPSATETPKATQTPADIGHIAPWTDTANQTTVVNWRLDQTTNNFGREDWHGTYFGSNNFTGTPLFVGENQEIPSAQYQLINNNYANNNPISGGPGDNFSIIWRRPIRLTDPTELVFDVTSVQNGGVRVYILGGAFGGSTTHRTGSPGACSTKKVRWNASQAVSSTNALGTTGNITGTYTGSDSPMNVSMSNRVESFQAYDDAYFGYAGAGAPPTECLVIDRWISEDADRSLYDVHRTVPAGEYLVVVEYAHTTGNSRIGVDFRNEITGGNEDDAQINSTGGLVSSNADCNWGAQKNTTNADTTLDLWDEYKGAMARGNMRCYLELRGWVEVPAAMTSPKLTFWDAWDIRGNASMAIEIADYDPDNDGVFSRGALTWTKIALRSGDSFNYNWTYNSVDLAARLTASTSRKLAIRFVMERRDNIAQTMLWNVDTITIDNMPTNTYYANKEWLLNTVTEKKDFITSGNWAMDSEATAGGGGGTGMAWNESPSLNTSEFSLSRNGDNSYLDGDLRMHTLEFNGFIDLDLPAGVTDYEGDRGDPLLTFDHKYTLGTRTGMEIQYSTTAYGVGPATWTVVPSGGQIIVRNNTSAEPSISAFEQVVIPLKDIPARRFRLRFVLAVNKGGTNRAGWWIDNIRLEREGRKRYLKYPFVDTAEDPAALLTNYALSGSWDRVTGGNRPAVNTTGNSYTDSPSGNYSQNTTNLMTFKAIFDLYNDTPGSYLSPVCNLVPSSLCETPNPMPSKPIMTFWHKRLISDKVSIAVDWKRGTETSTQWRTLWLYQDGYFVRSINSSLSSNGARAQRNEAWERVSINFAPVFAQLLADSATTRTDANKEDDDINIRLRFQTLNGNLADGVYFDDIKIEEASNLTHALWSTGQTRTDNGGATIQTNSVNVTGNGTTYLDTLDNRPWFDIWEVGGGWNAVTFEQRDGILSFHDSTTNLALSTNKAPNFASNEGTNGVIANRTFNTLEMKTVMDLRGVQTSDRPIMYFWSRWYSEDNRDYIGLQISVEDPTNATGGCYAPTNAPQCYQKDFGWGAWTTVWSTEGTREFLWERIQVDLTPYARSSTQNGRRIRIRFITDALDSGTHRDGFYVDQMQFGYFQPSSTLIGKNVSGGGFFQDRARNVDNWVMEGKWGLTPTIFKGGGGNAASIGGNPWNYKIWDINAVKSKVSNCDSLAFSACANTFLNTHSATTTPWASGFVADIRENWADRGPRNSSNVETRDRFIYQWEVTTPSTLPPGKYVFITAADDGVRLRYDTVPPGNLPAQTVDDPPNYSSTWNIVNNWQEQARTTTVSSARIAGLTQYKFTMQYFEAYNDASVQLSVGSFFFSFTSQPPNGVGRLASDQVPTMLYSNASMIYKGVFDLRQSTKPVIQYYTFYEFGNGNVGYLEVSVDGGFTWTQEGLRGSAAPSSLWATNWWGYYWNNTRTLDFATGGWPSPAPNFSTQPYTGFTGSPLRRDEGNAIDYNWSGSPLTGISSDNFSARFIRKLNTTDFTTLTFTVRGDDGFRLWVNYTPGCAIVGGNSQRPVISGNPQNWGQTGQPFNDPNAGCLLIDDWENQGAQTLSVTRTVPAGATIMLDYYEFTGNGEIRIDAVAGNYSSPQVSGVYMPDDSTTVPPTWQRRFNDLSLYAGPGSIPIMLRFRLDRLSNGSTTANPDPNTSNGNLFDYQNGWWLTEIEVYEP